MSGGLLSVFTLSASGDAMPAGIAIAVSVFAVYGLYCALGELKKFLYYLYKKRGR